MRQDEQGCRDRNPDPRLKKAAKKELLEKPSRRTDGNTDDKGKRGDPRHDWRRFGRQSLLTAENPYRCANSYQNQQYQDPGGNSGAEPESELRGGTPRPEPELLPETGLTSWVAGTGADKAAEIPGRQGDSQHAVDQEELRCSHSVEVDRLLSADRCQG
jgi:hypothetical protein